MNKLGSLRVSAQQKVGRTVLSSCFYNGALRVSRPIYFTGEYPTLYIVHIGGGYVDGDEYDIQFHVEEGARLMVTSQSSTKIYKTPTSEVRQQTEIILKKNSVFEWIADPIIAYRDAAFEQETIVKMEEGASFFLQEIITPGWSETGEAFQYKKIRTKLKVFLEEELIVYDHLLLQPDEKIVEMMQMEGFSHYGSFIVIHPNISKGTLDEIENSFSHFHMKANIGISSTIEPGFVIRVLANRTSDIEKIFASASKKIREILFHEEPVILRKY